MPSTDTASTPLRLADLAIREVADCCTLLHVLRTTESIQHKRCEGFAMDVKKKDG